MKRTTGVKNFAITITTPIAQGVAPWAMADDKGCSEETLKGTFGHSHRIHCCCPASTLNRAVRRGWYANLRWERRC
jgi:hypothetical protein